MKKLKQIILKLDAWYTSFCNKAYCHLHVEHNEQTIAWINHLDAMNSF